MNWAARSPFTTHGAMVLPLLDAITRCQTAGMTVKKARQIAGPLWSLVHGIASLAIDGELRNAASTKTPRDMVAYALSGLIRVR
jgi:Tetracyclin repressor-like, C-terminal domain